MKTNGATWERYLDSWPPGQWFDDSNETYDGKPADEISEQPPPRTCVVEFTCGVVYSNANDREGTDLVKHFRKWLKTLTLTSVVCEVPTDKLDEFTTTLKAMGGNRVS